jgi:hypothetical protein
VRGSHAVSPPMTIACRETCFTANLKRCRNQARSCHRSAEPRPARDRRPNLVSAEHGRTRSAAKRISLGSSVLGAWAKQ